MRNNFFNFPNFVAVQVDYALLWLPEACVPSSAFKFGNHQWVDILYLSNITRSVRNYFQLVI